MKQTDTEDLSKAIKFEAAWKEGFENFERVFDPLLNKSVKRKIDKDNEYFVPSQNGLYRYSLDENIKLDKRYGSWKNGSEEFGFQGAINHHIRDNYWNEDATYSLYNRDIGIFFIDIETRVGNSYKHFANEDEVVKIRKKE